MCVAVHTVHTKLLINLLFVFDILGLGFGVANCPVGLDSHQFPDAWMVGLGGSQFPEAWNVVLIVAFNCT